jgi:16S rRNA processing protein RimM
MDSDLKSPDNERRTPGGVAQSGSGQAGRQEPTHLVIGRVVGAFGIRGELKVRIDTDDPERFALLDKVYLGERRVRFEVDSSRLHQRNALMTLRGIADRDAAEKWRGAYVYIDVADALPLEEGEYYHHQVVGLAVSTEEGEDLGRVTEILTTGANDVFIIQGPRGEILLPHIADVVLDVNLDAGTITVRVPEGLL